MKLRELSVVLRMGRSFEKAIRVLKNSGELRKQYGENSKKAVEPYMLSLVENRVLELFNEFEGERE